MSQKCFVIHLNSGLVAVAKDMHQTARIGDPGHGPGQTLESFLSELVTVAIVERKRQELDPPTGGRKKACKAQGYSGTFRAMIAL